MLTSLALAVDSNGELNGAVRVSGVMMYAVFGSGSCASVGGPLDNVVPELYMNCDPSVQPYYDSDGRISRLGSGLGRTASQCVMGYESLHCSSPLPSWSNSMRDVQCVAVCGGEGRNESHVQLNQCAREGEQQIGPHGVQSCASK